MDWTISLNGTDLDYILTRSNLCHTVCSELATVPGETLDGATVQALMKESEAELERVKRELAEERYWFLADDHVDTLLRHGFGGLLVLIRCHEGRRSCHLAHLRENLAALEGKGWSLRDVSTWPHELENMERIRDR